MADVWAPPPSPLTTDGERVIRFVEAFCRLTKGAHAGDLMSLRPWQKAMIRELYRTDGGVRTYRQGYYQTPRKTGKSLIGAALCLFHLVADGENGAEVYSFAGDRSQARLVFKEAARMVELDPYLSKNVRVYRDRLEHPASNSVYQVRSAEAYTAHGLAPSFVSFDEVWNQPDEALWEAAVTGSATRERPLILAIGTPGTNKHSLAGRLYDMGKRSEPGFFFWCYEAPENADHTNVDVWKAAHPGAGDFASEVDFELACRTMPEGSVRRLYLGQWVSALEAWLPSGAWEACRTDRQLQPGETVVLGFDGSYAGDSTALVACTFDGHFATLGAWERPTGVDGEGWRVDIAEVEERIAEACGTYDVRAVVCDPYRWQRSIQAMQAQGLPIEEYPTSSPGRMVPSCTSFYDAVIERKVTHDGNPALSRHLANCMVKTDRLGPRIVKEHKNSSKKIDLAVAAVIAYDVARTEPEERFSGPMVY